MMRIDAPNKVMGMNKGKHASFEKGCEEHEIRDVEGAGDLMDYYDTEGKIAEVQRESVAKIDRHEQEDGYRN